MGSIINTTLHPVDQVIANKNANAYEQCFPGSLINKIGGEHGKKYSIHTKDGTGCASADGKLVPV